MLSKLKKTLLLAGLSLSLLSLVAPVTTHAQLFNESKNQACETLNITGGNPGSGCGTNSQNKVNQIVTVVINILSIVVGIAAVIMIIIGGFRYITSGGDSTAVNAAKNTLLYAVIGLAVVALAQFIVRYVLKRTGVIT